MKISYLLSAISILLVLQTTALGQCNPQPKADFSAIDVCVTDSVTFVNLSQNAESYLWKFGDGNISTKQSPKYLYKTTWGHPGRVTLVAKGSPGCADSITKQININDNPNSDFGFTINQNEVTFKPKQVGSTYYKWVFGKRDSIERIFPRDSSSNCTKTYLKLVTDTVCLEVINAAKCFSKTCKEVLIEVGISQIIKPKDFIIYPSPNSGNFTIKKVETLEVLTIEIFDQIGQVIHKDELKEYLNPLNLNLANGIYLIRITNVEDSLNQRMVVRK